MVDATKEAADATQKLDSRLKEQLDGLRTSYAEAVTAPKLTSQARLEALFVFEVGSAAFGIKVDRLMQVLPAKDVVAVPSAPPYVSGAIAFRQEAVSVLNLRALLQMPASEDGTGEWVLVLHPRSSQWALAADSTHGVHKVEAARLHRTSESEEGASIVVGEVLIDGRSVAILDVEALLSVVAPA